jgi:uncharacterized protein YndB with AHSA1/START domain
MSEQERFPSVHKKVTVPASPEHCFTVFTERPLDWWPPRHVLVKGERVALTFEPRIGGRYYETDTDGNECDWGRILDWNPPHGLTMTWGINGQWQPIDDDDKASEIEVSFRPVGAGTTEVELAHVKLHKHGPDAERIYQAVQGPSPGETLERFARAI